jgi:tetratricopeptide (TPR) repeat protein
MTRAQSVAWYARRAVAFALALFSIPLFFFYSDIVARAFQDVANLEVDPAYTGGRVASSFYDPVADDRGFGGLTYPKHERFVAGSLDLVQYAVHEPVYDAKWTSPKDYWQLDLAFASGPADVRNIRIYIGLADGENGAFAPRDDQAEGVAFDPSHPWAYVVAVSGSSGEIVSADGTLKLPAKVSSFDGGKKLTVRVPLSDRRLHAIYEATATAHYVLVGAWSPWGRDGFASVAARAGSGNGGGAPSSLAPKVYDWLAPDGTSQEEILSSWDDDSLEIPVLSPVIVSMRAGKSFRNTGSPDPRLAEFETLAAAETEAEKAALESAWEACREKAAFDVGSVRVADLAALSEYAVAAFRAGRRDEALAAFNGVLSARPNDPIALAYRGALVSMTARDASPLVAVDIVARAYADLDRAVALSKTPEEIITARMNRASVSQSVPETVFGKALQGAGDWLAAAESLKSLSASDGISREVDLANDYANAAICLEAAGKADDAGVWFRESARIANAQPAGSSGAARIRLELARRGLLAR